jgi:hypothetical protein
MMPHGGAGRPVPGTIARNVPVAPKAAGPEPES